MKKSNKNNGKTENSEDCRPTAEQSGQGIDLSELIRNDGLAMDDDAINEGVRKIFIMIGISPTLKGYEYLRDAIKCVVKAHAFIYGITTELYPFIAKVHDTNALTVEKAIRHAIETAWNRGRDAEIRYVFGERSYIESDKPANGEFIAIVAEKLIVDWHRARKFGAKAGKDNLFNDYEFDAITAPEQSTTAEPTVATNETDKIEQSTTTGQATKTEQSDPKRQTASVEKTTLTKNPDKPE